jgi:histidine triad (HIT) family protein
MDNCIFCRIARSKSRKFEKETDNFVVFESNDPRAPMHFLIVTKKHVKDVCEIKDSLWSEAKNIALLIAKEHKIKGFRLVANAGTATEIKHFHLHFLGFVNLEREL